MSSNESDEVNVSTIGSNLRKLDPSFDPRTYGYKSLTHLLKNAKNFEMKDNIINGLNYHMMKRKG